MGIKSYIVIVVLIIHAISVDVSASKRHKASGHKHKHSGRSYISGKKLLHRSPRDASDTFISLPTDLEMKSLCKEMCTIAKDTEGKGFMTLKRYDQKERSCVCVDEAGATVTKKLYKPKQETQGMSYLSKNKFREVIVRRGPFTCNQSDMSYGMCELFCHKLKKSDSFGCSNDGSQCLCYAIKEKSAAVPLTSSRTKRQLIFESMEGPGEEVVGMTITPPNPLQRPLAKQLFGPGPQPQPGPYPVISNGCNQYSCTNQCPYGCDSLCRQNRECFCSCPEDLTYEYYDEGPSFLGSLFG